MPLYPIQTPVKWNGKVRAKGQVDMPEEIARPLIALGALGESVGDTSTQDPPPDRPPTSSKKKVAKKKAAKESATS